MTAVDPLRDSGMPVAAAPASGRGPLIVVVGLIALAVAAFWPSIAALAELWSHPDRRTYQHGYLIAVIAAWLIYRERERITAAAGPPSYRMLAGAALGGIAWAIAWNASLQVVHFLLWPIVLWSALAGALGLRAGRVLLLPVGFIYFAMPIWDALMPILQVATVAANRFMGILTDVPMLIEGTYVHIPEGSFEIAGGCSGLNYLIVGLAIATLLGEVNRHGLRRRLLLIALGAGMAIVSNWLRVFIIIFAGHASNMTHYLVRVDHYNFGWFLYAFVLAAFFLVARRLPEDRFASLPASVRPVQWRFGASAIAGAAVVLVLGPLLVLVPAYGAGDDPTRGSLGVSMLDFDASDRWLAAPASGDWIPVFPGADAESLVEFAAGDEVVTAYTATYLRQRQGRELVGHESRIEGRAQGRFVRSSRRMAVVEPAVEVNESEWSSAGGGRALFWWTYQIGGRRFTSPLAAQVWYGISSLAGPPVSSVVALRAACASDCDRARLVLEAFATEALPQLLAASASSGN